MPSPRCRRRAKPYSDDELRNLRNTTSGTCLDVHNDLDQPDSGNPWPNARRVREHPYPRSAAAWGQRAGDADGPELRADDAGRGCVHAKAHGIRQLREFNYSFYDIIRRGYTRTASAGMLMPVDIEFSLPELRDGCWRRLPEWLSRRRSALAPANSLSLTTSLRNAKGNTREFVFRRTKVTAFSVAFSSLYSTMVTESETHDPPPCALTLYRASLVRENVSCAAWR